MKPKAALWYHQAFPLWSFALKLRTLGMLCLLVFLAACKKENPHDNARIPAPSSDHPVYNHRFDGGETDPYFKPGEGPATDGTEKAPKE